MARTSAMIALASAPSHTFFSTHLARPLVRDPAAELDAVAANLAAENVPKIVFLDMAPKFEHPRPLAEPSAGGLVPEVAPSLVLDGALRGDAGFLDEVVDGPRLRGDLGESGYHGVSGGIQRMKLTE